MNISALHNESFQSIDVIQKQIKDPDISYWFDQVYNNYKPHKDEIPPRMKYHQLLTVEHCFSVLTNSELLMTNFSET